MMSSTQLQSEGGAVHESPVGSAYRIALGLERGQAIERAAARGTQNATEAGEIGMRDVVKAVVELGAATEITSGMGTGTETGTGVGIVTEIGIEIEGVMVVTGSVTGTGIEGATATGTVIESGITNAGGVEIGTETGTGVGIGTGIGIGTMGGAETGTDIETATEMGGAETVRGRGKLIETSVQGVGIVTKIESESGAGA